jgi:hypothetical protein
LRCTLMFLIRMKNCEYCGSKIINKNKGTKFCSHECFGKSRVIDPITRIRRNIVIDPNTGCWNWQGYKNIKGYGRMMGMADRLMLTHVLAYTLKYGPVPKDMVVHHRCENPACCNVNHLEALTVMEHNHRSPRALAFIHGNKTHCPRGHEYTEENTLWCKRSNACGERQFRQCRVCHRMSEARCRAKKKEYG